MAVLVSLMLGALLAPKPATYQLSVQTWTFHRFTVFEALEKAARAGATNVELFPGQQLKSGSEVGVGPDMGEEATGALIQKLQSLRLKPIAFGVVDIPTDPERANKLFTWAKNVGFKILNTESAGSIDVIEQMVKKHDLRVGFHNHPRRPDDPGYRMWDPKYVLSLVQGRDRRIGVCADTGHWVRSGIKPMDALKLVGDRVVSSHLKDLSEFSPQGHDVPWGNGVSEVPAILGFYQRSKMAGSVSVEFEFNWDANDAEVALCLGFARGFAQSF